MTRRAALYLRVSTDKQTVENQELQLRHVAERRGWQVVEVYNDAGISGAKGRADRPGLDRMLNDASRRHFDIVLVWAIDRPGPSLIDLLGTIQHLSRRVRSVHRPTEHRHLDANGEADLQRLRCLRIIRA